MSKSMKITWTVAGILIGICLLVYFTEITKVTVKGNDNCTQKELEEYYLGNYFARNSLVLLVRDKLIGLPAHPKIQQMEIRWKSITRIEIEVYEKGFIGCINYMNQYIYFDRDGVVLKSSDALMEDVPCITGIEFGNFSLYETLDVQNDSVFNKIMNLTQTINHLSLQVDRIQIDSGGEVTMTCGDIIIKLGDREFYDEQLNVIPSVMKTVEEKKFKGIVDMRNFHDGDRLILKTQ